MNDSPEQVRDGRGAAGVLVRLRCGRVRGCAVPLAALGAAVRTAAGGRPRSRPVWPTLAARSLTVAPLLFFMLLLSACTTGPGEHGSHPAYPLRLEQRETLNIQVTRDVTKITFTNTTAHAFGTSRLWLNGEYGREVEPLDIGETITINLGDFVNEHGEPFRAGGFFAAEQPEVLVLAQLQVPDPPRLLGMIVVDGEAE